MRWKEIILRTMLENLRLLCLFWHALYASAIKHLIIKENMTLPKDPGKEDKF